MKKLQIALLTLLALASIVSMGCGGGGTPTFSKLPFASSREVASGTPLFVMNLDGSNVTPVDNVPNEDFISPSISANLKTIAYVLNGNVWTVNADGSGKTQLTTYDDQTSEVYHARVSPNGKKIVFSLYDGTTDAVWMMNVDGSNKKNLTATPPTGMDGCYRGSFSADGSKITFGCYVEDGGYAVYYANADGTNAKQVVALQDAFLDLPTFSPDGKKILFQSYQYIISAGIRSNATRKSAANSDSARARLHGHASLSHIAPRGVPSNAFGVFSINLDGSGAVNVAPNALELAVWNSSLYYTVADSELERFQIWKSNIDGTGAVKLSDGTADDALLLTFFEN